MPNIFVPSRAATDWRDLLAQPDKHWKPAFSAMSLAQCWHSAAGDLPQEIRELLGTAHHPALEEPELLLAIPEYQVALPGGSRATQTDVFALVRGRAGLAACAVEGKVDESFGPTIAAKERKGAEERLKYLHDLLEIDPAGSGALRYQLFHRTAAAILLAERFFAAAAVMIVHSFSPQHRWLSEFEEFGAAMGVQPRIGSLAYVGKRGAVDLYLGWAMGDQRFRSDLSSVTL